MAAVLESRVAAGSLNAVWVEGIADALSAAGVRHAVLCPGGRASAMCLALDAHAGIAVELVSTDERSGAFAALGMAKATGTPVAIVTTSGSAMANVLPALIEADACDIPLVVLTCDRPRALRGAGFGQMADHLGATRAFVRAQADLDDPFDSAAAFEAARTLLNRALAAMHGVCRSDVAVLALRPLRVDEHPSPVRAAPGPVHVNVPLAGVYDATETHPVSADTVIVAREQRAFGIPAAALREAQATPASIVGRVMASVRGRRRERSIDAGLDGLIVVGPEPGVSLEAIFRFATATGFPVLADAGSGLRAGPAALAPAQAARGAPGALIVNAFDVLGGSARMADARPDLIVRFGLAPVLPLLHTYLEALADVPAIKIAPHRVAHDYLHQALDPRDVLVAPTTVELGEMARALGDAVRGHLTGAAAASATVDVSCPVAFAWRDRWASVASYGARERRACVAKLGWGEVAAAHQLFAATGFGFVHIGNSMSMRHADIGYDVRAEPQDVYVNRGVSGIDGTLSTFIGEALVRRDAGLLVLGDQAVIHDLSALASAQRVTTPACVCVVDNGGGAIFDFLPIAQSPAYGRTIRNPYRIDIAALAQGFGLTHRRVASREALRDALEASRQHAGVTIVEIAVDAFSGMEQMQLLAQALGAD
ncbi:2-succinyl-5-enolpyruvyl-6-hydroxy-3-cyclohexene-1-carboxylic-acid synthase [Paraburkholderia phenazinium]|uniref:2-succinyl-5-enolpyruvyl-6-hydroxy-3-cyclohexene-1-carboxylate synthase n=1 Tax=Paraburkholderia phenazinium TaxID=60549 RepID=A0A1N6HQK2_9BURK|nr:2-succinyl-5-enolpyruvyl-6-hydroxy-3-cyclohexene-1-carboxylic-acid synthase [Paraburkholderia phenazinium]SIO22043.1 2-succinyl-5-enolpyruvyl-6-hydroxy-3-cyclohexene-1-carboxylate synthase [Paraburkholderia phenazinium]